MCAESERAVVFSRTRGAVSQRNVEVGEGGRMVAASFASPFSRGLNVIMFRCSCLIQHPFLPRALVLFFVFIFRPQLGRLFLAACMMRMPLLARGVSEVAL